MKKKISISKEHADKIIALGQVKTFDEVSKILGIQQDTLSRTCRNIKQRFNIKVSFADALDTLNVDQIIHENSIEEGKTSMNISAKVSSRIHDRQKNLEAFLKTSQVDMKVWEVEKYAIKAWDVTMSGVKSSTNSDATYTNYGITVTLKKKIENFDKEAFFQQIEAIVANSKIPVRKIEYRKTPEGNLLVLTINDLHLGRVSWAPETEVNYDSKVACEYMREGLASLTSKAQNMGISHILYYVGHDFFTYDNASPFPSTTHGTYQEADSRWQKMFMMGIDLQVSAIRMLSQIAPVTVQEISGNHDKQASFYLGQVLSAIFKDDPNVHMDISPKPRHYFRWGESLIGAGHGQREKAIDLHAVMTAEARQDMGQTKYWYMVMGHMHHYVEKRRRVVAKPTRADRAHGLQHIEEIDEDYKGLTITYLPNLAERDAYEVENCYVGTIRGAMGSVYSPTKGRIAVFQHNL